MIIDSIRIIRNEDYAYDLEKIIDLTFECLACKYDTYITPELYNFF